MHSLQKQFHDFIKAHQLIETGEKVLLAVSGGVDSMVMLALLRDSEIDFGVAHCNFGLRGKDSDGDEALVTRITKEIGAPYHVKHISIEEGSVQLEAREKRYQWFELLMAEEGYSKLATAHHLDDSLETTLLNLVRGTGIHGLKGIPVKNEKTIRPLLFASKSQLVAFADDKKLKWREDRSNQKKDYDRNKVRLEVIPRLAELNPSLIETHRDTKERMDLAADFVAKQATEVVQKYFDAKTRELSLKWVRDRSDLILLNEILSVYGFNYKTVKEIYEAIGKSGKRFPSEKYEVTMDRASLFIRKSQEEGEKEALVVKEEGSYQYSDSSFLISTIETPQNLNQGRNVALLAADKARFPFRIRRWEEGDYFVPFGMEGRKKVSDFLVDQKVPLALKKDVLVLEVNDEIAWVVGYRISEKFRVEMGKKVLRIEDKI